MPNPSRWNRLSVALIALAEIALAATSGTGCAWVEKRVSLREARCEELCAQSKAAQARGELGEAQRLANAARSTKPNDIEARLEVATALTAAGQFTVAMADLEKLSRKYPQDASIPLKLAQLAWQEGQDGTAESYAQESLNRDSGQVAAIRLLADVAERRGQLDEALHTYHQAAELSPDDLTIHLKSAVIQLKRGNADRAAPVLRSITQSTLVDDAIRNEAEWQLGAAYCQLERWDDAATSLQAAAKQRTCSAADYCLIAEVEERAGHPAAAELARSAAVMLDTSLASWRPQKTIMAGGAIGPNQLIDTADRGARLGASQRSGFNLNNPALSSPSPTKTASIQPRRLHE